MPDILSSEQIRKTENLNLEAVKFYLESAEKMLTDHSGARAQFDQKSFTLLAGYITVALALFGLAEKFNGIGLFGFWLNTTSMFFCVGVIPLFLSMTSKTYGVIGKHPCNLLKTEEYLTVKSENMALMYAYLLRDYVSRIDNSVASNKKKARFLNIAILLGVASLIPFSIKFIFGLS